MLCDEHQYDAHDDMHQDDAVMMIRMIICDEYKDDTLDDIHQEDAMMMIRMIICDDMYQVDTLHNQLDYV